MRVFSEKLKKKVARLVLLSLNFQVFSSVVNLHAASRIDSEDQKIISYFPQTVSKEKEPLLKTVNVAPDQMFGIDIRGAFEGIIQEAKDRDMLEELPTGLVNCYLALKKGYDLYISDLAESFLLLTKNLLADAY